MVKTNKGTIRGFLMGAAFIAGAWVTVSTLAPPTVVVEHCDREQVILDELTLYFSHLDTPYAPKPRRKPGV